MAGKYATCDKLERSFWMTRSMARILGVSLTEAMRAGVLTPDGYCEMVARCGGADCRRTCEVWLALQPGQAASAPRDCANCDAFDRLQALLGRPIQTVS